MSYYYCNITLEHSTLGRTSAKRSHWTPPPPPPTRRRGRTHFIYLTERVASAAEYCYCVITQPPGGDGETTTTTTAAAAGRRRARVVQAHRRVSSPRAVQNAAAPSAETNGCHKCARRAAPVSVPSPHACRQAGRPHRRDIRGRRDPRSPPPRGRRDDHD